MSEQRSRYELLVELDDSIGDYLCTLPAPLTEALQVDLHFHLRWWLHDRLRPLNGLLIASIEDLATDQEPNHA